MTIDEMKKRFVEEIKLRAYDDKFIDRNEERDILKIAVEHGISVDSARSALNHVCEANDFVVESQVRKQLKDLLDTFAGKGGKIDEKEFNDALTTAKKWTKGKRTDIQVTRLLVDIIAENAYETSKGWSSDWYQSIKKEL